MSADPIAANKGLHLLGAGAIVALCFLFRDALERDPVLHVLVQLPALAAAGWIAGRALRGSRLEHAINRFNGGGAAGLLIVLVTLAFWMLPRSLDAALGDPWAETLKFISLPCLLGLPLALSWRQAHPVVRGFLKANAVSMLGVLAFLYTHAPIRICNNYLVSDQERLGMGFLITAAVLAGAWSVPLFMRPPRQHREAGLA